MTEKKDTKKKMRYSLLCGMAFGALLTWSGVLGHDTILNQLLLKDFTVFKVMFTAVIVGMPGVLFLEKNKGIELKPKPGSIGSTVAGGLIFGIGFALLGYCPGTAVGALGTGSLDALFGIFGMIIGAGLFAVYYPKFEKSFLHKGEFRHLTLEGYAGVENWKVVAVVEVVLITFLASLELFL